MASLPETNLFEPTLLMGTVAAVDPSRIRINLSKGGLPTSTVFAGARYGLGVVGEFVMIEGEGAAQFGRIVEVRLPERERLSVEGQIGREVNVHAIGIVQLLASVSLRSFAVQPGIENYPRIGARVFAAPFDFVSTIPIRAEKDGARPEVALQLGYLKDAANSVVEIAPEKIFGRHCAVLGATGGGKSFTVATLVEECARLGGKAILLDPSGEYHSMGARVKHAHLGGAKDRCATSEECVLPYHSFSEQDFVALFQPAGKTQGPKLRAAIRSLRLVSLQPALATHGCLVKKERKKKDVADAEGNPSIAEKLEAPRTPFNVSCLAMQLREECIYESGFTNRESDSSIWGGYDDGTYSYCLTLVSRINSVLQAPELRCIFRPEKKTSLFDAIEKFLSSSDPVLRISLEQLSFEFSAREIVANTIGRHLLELARSGRFKNAPLIVLLDEAHQFLDRSVGSDEYAARWTPLSSSQRRGGSTH